MLTAAAMVNGPGADCALNVNEVPPFHFEANWTCHLRCACLCRAVRDGAKTRVGCGEQQAMGGRDGWLCLLSGGGENLVGVRYIRRCGAVDVACDHTTEKIPDPVRSPQSSSVGLAEYCGGRPHGNGQCCRPFFFLFFLHLSQAPSLLFFFFALLVLLFA